MSSGVTATGETCIEVIKKGRVNIKITKKEWCGYKGICENELTLQGDKICHFCIYMLRFNIPEMIEKSKGENKNG